MTIGALGELFLRRYKILKNVQPKVEWNHYMMKKAVNEALFLHFSVKTLSGALNLHGLSIFRA